MDIEKLVKEPIFFEPNRVYRIYLGGALYEKEFTDKKDFADGNFPEEWIASKVKAINPVYFGERDGVGRIKDSDIFFDDLLREYERELCGPYVYDCLVKFLDSSIRLPFQVHPTKEFSQKHFKSNYGKTEAWLVVATRENAKLYFGFKNKITKEELSELEERSEYEKDIMGTTLHGVDVKVGDVWLIKAGLIHAIGAGCTIIEVQEPTDFTIQPERWVGDYHLSPQEEYIGLDKSTALDAINYDIFGERAVLYAKVNPYFEIDTDDYQKQVLVGYDDTTCFAENRHILKNGGKFTPDFAPCVYVCLNGEGVIKGENYNRPIKKGEYFFLPYSAKGRFEITTDKLVEFVECLPSKQD